PLDQIIVELSRARDGAAYIISEIPNRASNHPAAPSMVQKIIYSYEINLLAILSRTLEIYNQRTLSGERVSEYHKQNWIQAVSYLIAILYARSESPVRSFDDVPATYLDRATVSRWTSNDVRPKDSFDAHVAAALSAVLLHSDGRSRRVSALACSVASYHIAKAREEVPEVVTTVDLNPADEARAAQYIFVVRDLIQGSCSNRKQGEVR